jgi:hypothetical protein
MVMLLKIFFRFTIIWHLFLHMAYWTSKLGNKFLQVDIERNDSKTKKQLDNLRRQAANRRCADCGSEPTVWASVNLGIFLCIRCGSLHRGVGTHISVPKGCTGTSENVVTRTIFYQPAILLHQTLKAFIYQEPISGDQMRLSA